MMPTRVHASTLVAITMLALAGSPLLEARAAPGPAPAWVEVFGQYATTSGGRVIGRTHRGTPPMFAPGESGAAGGNRSAQGSTNRRVLATLTALEGRVLGGAPVKITVGALEGRVSSDERGYFELPVPAGLKPGVVPVVARLDDARFAPAEARFDLPVFDDAEGLGLISDVDDTLVDTGVTNKLRMAARTLHGGGQPFPGVAEALAALVRDPAGARPILYVSGSPWGLFARIAAAFRAAGFPTGPLLLKRFSTEPWTDQMAYKYPRIIAALDALPRRRWILLGDSGEKDPEVYARIVRERPDRVAAVYIHLVTDEPPDASRFQGMIVFRQWSEVTADATRRKLLAAR